MNGICVAMDNASERRPPRQRSSIACQYCHGKRIKCNASERIPCSNCHRNGNDCLLIASKRGKNRKLAPRSKRVHLADESRSPAGNERTESRPLEGDHQVVDDTGPAEEVQPDKERSEMLYAEILDTHSARSRRNLIKPGGQVVYLGETFNLTYLLEQSQPEPEDRDRSRQLHYAVPAGLEKESTQHEKQVDPLTLDLLERQNAFDLPSKEMCLRLFDGYFECVQPHYPIIDRAAFLKQHVDLSKPPSWLLLQAVLFMAAGHCEETVIQGCGFESRADARLTLFKRTKALYDVDHEKDKVTTVQALFLMSFWWATPMDEKDTWHWLGNAISLALTIGMHRSTRCSEMDIKIQRLWKRIWWSLFTEDKHAAAALGRPVHIRQSDCDVEPLDLRDFEDPEQDMQHQLTDSEKVHALYVIHLSKLSKIVERIIDKSIKSSEQSSLQRNESLESCDHMLSDWLSQLPFELHSNAVTKDGNLWRNMLHVAFQ